MPPVQEDDIIAVKTPTSLIVEACIQRHMEMRPGGLASVLLLCSDVSVGKYTANSFLRWHLRDTDLLIVSPRKEVWLTRFCEI